MYRKSTQITVNQNNANSNRRQITKYINATGSDTGEEEIWYCDMDGNEKISYSVNDDKYTAYGSFNPVQLDILVKTIKHEYAVHLIAYSKISASMMNYLYHELFEKQIKENENFQDVWVWKILHSKINDNEEQMKACIECLRYNKELVVEINDIAQYPAEILYLVRDGLACGVNLIPKIKPGVTISELSDYLNKKKPKD